MVTVVLSFMVHLVLVCDVAHIGWLRLEANVDRLGPHTSNSLRSNHHADVQNPRGKFGGRGSSDLSGTRNQILHHHHYFPVSRSGLKGE